MHMYYTDKTPEEIEQIVREAFSDFDKRDNFPCWVVTKNGLVPLEQTEMFHEMMKEEVKKFY